MALVYGVDLDDSRLSNSSARSIVLTNEPLKRVYDFLSCILVVSNPGIYYDTNWTAHAERSKQISKTIKDTVENI
jgi:hypothetical protein